MTDADRLIAALEHHRALDGDVATKAKRDQLFEGAITTGFGLCETFLKLAANSDKMGRMRPDQLLGGVCSMAFQFGKSALMLHNWDALGKKHTGRTPAP